MTQFVSPVPMCHLVPAVISKNITALLAEPWQGHSGEPISPGRHGPLAFPVKEEQEVLHRPQIPRPWVGSYPKVMSHTGSFCDMHHPQLVHRKVWWFQSACSSKSSLIVSSVRSRSSFNSSMHSLFPKNNLFKNILLNAKSRRLHLALLVLFWEEDSIQMSLPPRIAGCICPTGTGSTGLHGTSRRSYHTHISQH